MCQVTFNIYVVSVVSMHSPLSLYSRSIPTVNRLMQKQQLQVAFVAFPILGVANGKIRDSPRRRDPS